MKKEAQPRAADPNVAQTEGKSKKTGLLRRVLTALLAVVLTLGAAGTMAVVSANVADRISEYAAQCFAMLPKLDQMDFMQMFSAAEPGEIRLEKPTELLSQPVQAWAIGEKNYRENVPIVVTSLRLNKRDMELTYECANREKGPGALEMEGVEIVMEDGTRINALQEGTSLDLYGVGKMTFKLGAVVSAEDVAYVLLYNHVEIPAISA